MDTFGSYGQYFSVLDKSEFLENNGLLISACSISKIIMVLLLVCATYYSLVDRISAVWFIVGFLLAVLANNILFKILINKLLKTFRDVRCLSDNSFRCAIDGHNVLTNHLEASHVSLPSVTVAKLEFRRFHNHSILFQSDANIIDIAGKIQMGRNYYSDDLCRKFNMYVSDSRALSEWLFTEKSLSELLRALKRCAGEDGAKAAFVIKQDAMTAMYSSNVKLFGCRIIDFDYKELVEQKFDYVSNAVALARTLVKFSDFKEANVEEDVVSVEENAQADSSKQDTLKNNGQYRPSPEFLNHQWKSSYDFKNGHRF